LIPGRGRNPFPFRHRVYIGSGAHPASHRRGTGGSSPGIKRSGIEADHSSPSSAELKNMLSYTSIPPNIIMACSLFKHRDDVTFYQHKQLQPFMRCCVMPIFFMKRDAHDIMAVKY